MKPISTSCYTFADLIAGGYLYVDKTAQIHQLVAPPKMQAFISRPRRFGKSLLISTLKAIFQGRKDLFAGLAIEKLRTEWLVHPVIHLDMGSKQAATPEELERKLIVALDNVAMEYNITLSHQDADQRFEQLVLQLSQRAPVVILVDEYDKPLLGQLENKESASALLPVLKKFYGVIKTTEAHQRLALITGVGKFAKVSLFSDLNNLDELTFQPRCATLLGYTQEELEAHFADGITELAAQEGMERAAMLAQIREWYNGYRFARNTPSVYNPVSIGKLFSQMDFANFWFETGTPSFLLRLIRDEQADMTDVTQQWVDVDSFDSFDVNELSLQPLLVQTGYLTLAEYDNARKLYRLDYPNREVRESFNRRLLPVLAAQPLGTTSPHLNQLEMDIRAGDLSAMMENLRVFFAKIPYDIQIRREKYYQSIFHVIFTLLGYRMQCEVRTNRGRVDAVLETADRVLVIEFKLNGTAAEALAQIRKMDYHQRWLGGPKKVTLVGAAFDPATRNLGDCVAEDVPTFP